MGFSFQCHVRVEYKVKGLSPIGYLFLWEGVWGPWERLFGEVVAYGVARGSSIVGGFASVDFRGPPLPADGKEVGRGGALKSALANHLLYY